MLIPEQRSRLARVKQGDKKAWYQVCEEYEVSKSWYYELRARFKAKGVEGLKSRSKAPKRVWNKCSKAKEDIIILLRKRVPTWGTTRIRNLLKAIGIKVCPKTVHNVSKRRGFIEERRSRRRYKAKVLKSTHKNEVWQIDLFQFKLKDRTTVYGVLVEDTYSRFIVGCRLFLQKTTANVILTLEEAFQKYGRPEKVQFDNGSQFVPRDPEGSHMFQEFCDNQKTEHVTIPKGKPQKNGKIERSIQNVKQEVIQVFRINNVFQGQSLMDSWMEFHNYFRPHLGLKGKTPNELFQLPKTPNVCRFLSRVRNDQLVFSGM